MDHENRPDDRLEQQLEELAQYATRSTFSQLYFRLLLGWAREVGAGGATLREACSRFLDSELWYHQALADLGRRETVTYDDLRSLADKRRINLTALSEAVEGLVGGGSRGDVVRHLLLAECHFHLQEPERVVGELEAAIESGGGHPYVHFALGLSRFERARELHATAQETTDRDRERLENRFEKTCLAAVDAFKDALTGRKFDAWCYFYIGRALAAAGMVDEASAALETAARIDSSVFAEPSIVDRADGALDEQLDPEGIEERAPITEQEVREFGQMLKRSWRPEDLLGND